MLIAHVVQFTYLIIHASRRKEESPGAPQFDGFAGHLVHKSVGGKAATACVAECVGVYVCFAGFDGASGLFALDLCGRVWVLGAVWCAFLGCYVYTRRGCAYFEDAAARGGKRLR